MKKAMRNRGGAGRGETVKRQRLSVEREIPEAMRKVEPPFRKLQSPRYHRRSAHSM
jgi:hypothetical protein